MNPATSATGTLTQKITDQWKCCERMPPRTGPPRTAVTQTLKNLTIQLNLNASSGTPYNVTTGSDDNVSRSEKRNTAVTTKISARPVRTTTEPGRKARASGKAAPTTNVQPIAWWRNAARA